jgi:FkbM family methyltransferase
MSAELFEVIHELGLPHPKGVLQVGASYGQELQLFWDKGIRHGVFIEPLSEPFQFLSEQCKLVPGYVAVQALCTDESNKAYPFYVSSNRGMSSSLLRPVNHLLKYDHVKFNETIEITSKRLEDVLGFLVGNGYTDTIAALDTLYMDTQGAELKVLLGAGCVLQSLRYVYTEVTRNELYEGAPTLQTLVSFLDCYGFTLNNVNFSKTGSANAFFIKKELAV